MPPTSGGASAEIAGWKIKKGAKEHFVSTIEAIREMAQTGKLKPDDYVWNPTLSRWLYAKETAELDNVFSDAKSREIHDRLQAVSWFLVLLSLLVGVSVSVVWGGVLFFIALILAVMWYVMP